MASHCGYLPPLRVYPTKLFRGWCSNRTTTYVSLLLAYLQAVLPECICANPREAEPYSSTGTGLTNEFPQREEMVCVTYWLIVARPDDVFTAYNSVILVYTVCVGDDSQLCVHCVSLWCYWCVGFMLLCVWSGWSGCVWSVGTCSSSCSHLRLHCSLVHVHCPPHPYPRISLPPT